MPCSDVSEPERETHSNGNKEGEKVQTRCAVGREVEHGKHERGRDDTDARTALPDFEQKAPEETLLGVANHEDLINNGRDGRTYGESDFIRKAR